MENRYFRAGVGTVIYRHDNSVAYFRRTQRPVGVWQFQQGGVDPGEDTETTLWRELQEETGLTKKQIEKVTEMPGWTVYEDQSIEGTKQNEKMRIGQAHHWYFLKLKQGVEIDLNMALLEEFDELRWLSFDEVLEEVSHYKKHVYEALHKYFITNVETQP